MNEQNKITLEDVIDIVQKKWCWISIPFLFFFFLGLWAYVVLPREYEASTLILVQPQEIPAAYVVATVSTGLEERVRTLSQEVMSRSNLEKIILEMDLYHKERAQGVPMDMLIGGMRKRIKVDVGGEAGRPGQVSSFTLTYRGRDPQNVADVTNRLASLFIESNLRVRAKQASETTIFLEKQLADLKSLLDDYEKKVQEYRNTHMGVLPEQLASNTTTLTNLQASLETVQRSLTDARNRKILIQGQISQMESAAPGTTPTQRDQRLAEMRQRLQDMKTTYTPEHPELKRLAEQIKELESQARDRTQVSTDPRVQELRLQLRAVTIEIANLEGEIGRIKARINFYQERVESTPKSEQEMATLMRDYQITQENYQRLLDRSYEAKRAESMEKRQQGEQFRILDLAQAPQTPISPNIVRLALMFLFLGLGSGAGVVLLLEVMDSSIKSQQQLADLSGNIPCISSIPMALTQADKTVARRKTTLLIFANLAIVGAGMAVVIVSKAMRLTVDLPFNLPF